MTISYVIFIGLFLYIANRHGLYFLTNLIRGAKIIREKSRDKKILGIMNRKAKISLDHFYVIDSGDAWGMMAGIPGFPQLFLRKDIYKQFANDEMQWLILHEAGHYKLWHTTREFFHQLISLGFGIWVISTINKSFLQIIISAVLAIILGIYSVQVGKLHEAEAEKFALSRVDNPEGMVASGYKSIQGWKRKGLSEKSIWHKLFDRWEISMYKKRIKMANEKLKTKSAKFS